MGFGSRFVVWLLLLGLPLGGVSAGGIWSERLPDVAARSATVPAFQYRSLQADRPALESLLATAPLEFTASEGAPLQLPLPDGSFARFSVEESPIMAPELARRYPEIRTYSVRGIDQPTATGRLDLTPQGFHAMLDTPAGVIFIDPDDQGGYRSYFKRDYVLAARGELSSRPYCVLQEVEQDWEQRVAEASALAQRLITLTGQRRVYRLAVAATGEYTQFHGGTNAQALDAIVTAINRVNQIYGRDLAIQFELVANNDSLIYIDGATDPYTNTDVATMLSENQANLDSVIGSANYDIGHVFGTGSGGIARVGSSCAGGIKAQGATGSLVPNGDTFWIDFVAHEIGHQFNAAHTFNGTTGSNCSGGRSPLNAVEPGSGTSIMAYAGICSGENIQQNSDATFHARSIEQIAVYADSQTCGSQVSTGNTAPVAAAGSNYTVPRQTPFRLTGTATDVDGDSLSYQWDELDVGASTDASTLGTDLGSNPLFRSFLPKSGGMRDFPRVSELLVGLTNNHSADKGETLPSTNRTLNFRLTVRDGNSGVDEDDVSIVVDSSSGPFAITGGTLVTTATSQGGVDRTLTWTTNTTSICSALSVELLALSADGYSYCDASDDVDLDLGSGFLNSIGNATVTLPQRNIARARVRLYCNDNIFFDLSDSDISVESSLGAAVATNCKAIDGGSLEHGTVFNDAGTNLGSGGSSSDSDSGGGGSLLWLPLLFSLIGLSRTSRRCLPLRFGS